MTRAGEDALEQGRRCPDSEAVAAEAAAGAETAGAGRAAERLGQGLPGICNRGGGGCGCLACLACGAPQLNGRGGVADRNLTFVSFTRAEVELADCRPPSLSSRTILSCSRELGLSNSLSRYGEGWN